MVRCLFSFLLLLLSPQLFAEKILFLGDSLSMGAFSTRLQERFEEAGHSISYYASSGGNPYYWLDKYQSISVDQKILHTGQSSEIHYGKSVPKMSWLYQNIQPHIVVVQAGNGLYFTLKKYGEEMVKQKVTELINRIVHQGGSRCFWIMPPTSDENAYSLERQETMERVLLEVTSKDCPAFASRKVTEAPQDKSGDGIHFGPDEYRNWAEKTFTWLVDKMHKLDAPPTPFVAGNVLRAIPLNEEIPVAVPVDEAVYRLRLIEKSLIPSPVDAPYGNALVLYRYQNLDTNAEVYVKHYAFKNRVLTDESRFQIGDEFDMTLEKPDESLNALYLSDDFLNFEAEHHFATHFKKINPTLAKQQ